MPTRDEFKSLNIFKRNDGYPIIEDLVKIGFEVDKDKLWFWTSEEYNTGIAYGVGFGYGLGDYVDMSNGCFVVCVRRS